MHVLKIEYLFLNNKNNIILYQIYMILHEFKLSPRIWIRNSGLPQNFKLENRVF